VMHIGDEARAEKEVGGPHYGPVTLLPRCSPPCPCGERGRKAGWRMADTRFPGLVVAGKKRGVEGNKENK
jgi:hypothetical protein